MKNKLLSQPFLRGFIYVLTLGLVSIPTAAKGYTSARTARPSREMAPLNNNHKGYFVVGPEGMAHDLEMFLVDSHKCAQAYNKKASGK